MKMRGGGDELRMILMKSKMYLTTSDTISLDRWDLLKQK